MVFFLPANQMPFNELQPDTLNGQVLKYVKTVYQLEKGLPPNAVVPKLKEKVEDLKDKVQLYCLYCMTCLSGLVAKHIGYHY